MNQKQIESLADDMMDLFQEIEDVKSVFGQTTTKNEGAKPMLGMLNALGNKLDMSKARASKDEDLLDAVKRRIGEAYGTYIKLLGMANRAKAEHKDIAYLHGELESMGKNFKKLINSVNKIVR